MAIGRLELVHFLSILTDIDVLIHLDDYHFEAETLFNEILKEDIKDENYVEVPVYLLSRILAKSAIDMSNGNLG